MELTEKLLQEFSKWGVTEYCLCPGGRNAPFIEALTAREDLKIFNFFDERAAGFFALARTQSSRRPVVVCTTSGTAVANLLPAVIEAYYTGTPLILLTADRPKRYRGTASPQVIEQYKIFGNYVSACYDLEDESAEGLRPPVSQPLHINFCFSEPLIDGETPSRLINSSKVEIDDFTNFENPASKSLIAQFTAKSRNPLVLVSGIQDRHQTYVEEWLKTNEGYFYLEASSGLWASPDLRQGRLLSGDLVLRENFREHFDGVIRIGRIPTLRLWRDLETNLCDVPVLNVSDLTFSGLSHVPNQQTLSIGQLNEVPLQSHKGKSISKSDAFIQEKLNTLFKDFPLSEPAWVRRLSNHIPSEALMYLGNSLPLREWDLFADPYRAHSGVRVNRGANGIDGQISSFLGHAIQTKESWALLGDLTALYDGNAFWATRHLPQGSNTRTVVLNNRGGQIFKRMFKNEWFRNEHQLNFKGLADLWGLTYSKCTEELHVYEGDHALIEVLPEAGQTDQFWSRLEGETK